jgi:hypothetical protein
MKVKIYCPVVDVNLMRLLFTSRVYRPDPFGICWQWVSQIRIAHW